MEKLSNYINGELVPPAAGEYLENVEPATGTIYSMIPDSDENDVDRAYQAASEAFRDWSGRSAQSRATFLRKIADLIDANHHELAEAESRDNGKPLKLAQQVDIPRASSNFRFYAGAIEHFYSESHYTEGVEALNYTRRKPLGVVSCISPWNLPLYLFTWKVAPALAAGNTVVAKPSELTPYTAYLLGKLCIEAGLPKGVLNVVHGAGLKAGRAIVSHRKSKAISFTGGTSTGKEIASVAAPKFKKLSLELGGKNPNLVFADCDLELAVKESAKAAFSNQGQICLCGSRILIQSSIYDEFKSSFLKVVQKLKVGLPQNPETQLGALVSEQHMEKVLHYIELARSEGGHILSGGNRVYPPGGENGYYIEPTVIESLPSDCRTNQEEIFGPVVTLIPFNNRDEAIVLANDSEYGLSATVWTNNLKDAHKVADQLESGIVWVNCWLLRDLRTPFGGQKSSGVGREGGFEALRFFTEPKNICIKL